MFYYIPYFITKLVLQNHFNTQMDKQLPWRQCTFCVNISILLLPY
jgi:hypothetical protein